MLSLANKTNVLTNFHDDWAKIVISRVFTRKTAPRPGSHVIQLTVTIFELNSHIKETNVLTKFHENWAKHVTSRMFKCFHHIHKEKNAPPTGGHVFSPIWTIFELVRDIYKTNVLTNFHDDWAKIVTSRVFTRKTDPRPSSHVIQLTGTIFELNSLIKETNVLTKFHENWAKNVTSRIEKCPAHWRPCFFSPIWTIFELVRDINKTNVLTNFHDDWAKIVTSRVFTRKTAPHPGSHVFQLTGTIFELNSHIKETNFLTKFHEIGPNIEKCPAHWRPCFSPIWTIFELVRNINKTNILTNFHDDWKKKVTSRVFTRKTAPPAWQPCYSTDRNHFRAQLSYQGNKLTSRVFTCFHYIHIEKNAPPTGGHVFSPIWCIFELVRDINKTNQKLKTAPPTGGHVFQRTGTTFKLDQHIIKANILTNFELDQNIIRTNLLTKFHEDRT
ncbi:hypothetical protein DPMN_166283 [Dreissena polymorpha]|uniref:Uncharacterized protein n=1 Tax=Dreissena polymorpha TaxID=45954 RepID=A0A9D4IU08_DREPO|nr:hypothetical protein DPMN_166283 [Dreissena polymorpha]